MKKIVTLLLIILLLTLCSCGGKPTKMSEGMYQIGLNALDVADQYINGKLTGNRAYDRLEDLYEQAKEEEKYNREKLGVATLVGTEYAHDTFVTSDILILQLVIGRVDYGSATLSDVIEARDELADTLGQ